MTARILAVCILVLLALPLATAAPPQAVFQAAAASWNDAPASSNGFVAATSLWPISRTDTPTAADSGFDLQAARVGAAWDTAALYLDAPPAAFLPADVSHGSATYTTAHLRGTTSGIARALYVFPLDGQAVQVSMPCANARAPLQKQVGAVSHADTARGTQTADVSQAVQITPCAGASVTGTFAVILWDWNATVTAQEGNAALWSGKAKQDTAPDPLGVTGGQPYVNRAQQVFLTVHNGTLMLPVSTQPPLLFVSSVGLAGAPSLDLADATGTLAGQHLDAHRLHLTGALNAALARDGNAVALQVTDGLRGADADGHPYSLTTTAPSSGRGLWAWLLGLGGLGLVVSVPVLMPVARRSRRSARIHATACRAEELLCRAQASAALPLTSKLLRLEPQNPDWLYLHGLALLGVGRAREAHALHKAVRALHPAPSFAADNACAGALAAAHLHARADGDERREWLSRVLAWMDEAIQADPGMARELERSEVLVPFLRARDAFAAMMG